MDLALALEQKDEELAELRSKLHFLATFVETDDGTFRFPDGDSLSGCAMRKVTIDDYQRLAGKTAVYPTQEGYWQNIVYPTLGLVGESGELANKIKKLIRGDYQVTVELREQLMLELGDCLWYVAMLARDLGYTLEQVAVSNLNKLASRHERQQIKGSGDKR